MSQMDDILSEQDKEAVQQIAQDLQKAEITQDSDYNNQPPDNSDSNTNSDPDIYRSLESDVGNMNGKQLPSADEPEATTQMDEIEVEQEKTSHVERLEQERTAEKEEPEHER